MRSTYLWPLILALGARPLVAQAPAAPVVEAFRLFDRVGESVWPGWGSAPSQLLLGGQHRVRWQPDELGVERLDQGEVTDFQRALPSRPDGPCGQTGNVFWLLQSCQYLSGDSRAPSRT